MTSPQTTTLARPEPAAPEARSGLEAWSKSELPPPPMPRGLGWLAVVGPGVIVLGAAIGSGEFLLGPAVFVRHGFTLLWVTSVAIFLQTVFNMEIMRYTVATGEPAFTGFMRTRPSSTAWGWFYAALYFLQVGWPAWAANAAGAIFFLFAGRLAGPEDAQLVYYIGIGTFLVCVAIFLVGQRIARTLELLNWIMVVSSMVAFVALALKYVPGATWLAAGTGFFGFDLETRSFLLMPEGADFFLIAALVAYAGCGGVSNITLANWARDKGYGMSERAGYIPAAFAGQSVHLAHTGFTFEPDEEAMRRWHGWWRIVRADQWGVFFTGAVLGMALPALLYVTFLPPGTDIRGLGIAAALAESIGEQAAPFLAVVVALLAAWILLKTQIDNLEGMVRAITDILWTGSRRIRAVRGGDIRFVYYTVMTIVVIWGIIALRLAQPIVLLQIGANVAGAVFAIASLHILYINTRLLPPAIRPPMWRRLCLVAMALFYGSFLALSVHSVL